jgi:hypothetical protein
MSLPNVSVGLPAARKAVFAAGGESRFLPARLGWSIAAGGDARLKSLPAGRRGHDNRQVANDHF